MSKVERGIGAFLTQTHAWGCYALETLHRHVEDCVHTKSKQQSCCCCKTHVDRELKAKYLVSIYIIAIATLLL